MADDSQSKRKTKDGSSISLAELGYVERRKSMTTVGSGRTVREAPGSIGFDELGNAQFQWKDERMLEEGEHGDTRRQRALSAANLVLVDDEPGAHFKTISVNKQGLRVGYNPYDSGRLNKEARKKPRDLRALSKWIEMQRRTAGGEDQADE